MAYITCPKCKYTVSDSNGSCSVCNYKFTKKHDTNWQFEGQQGFSQANFDDMNDPYYISPDKISKDDWRDIKKSHSANPIINKLSSLIKHKLRRMIFKLAFAIILTIIIAVYTSLDFTTAMIIFLIIIAVISR